jgi:hypothetical protein
MDEKLFSESEIFALLASCGFLNRFSSQLALATLRGA